MEDEPQTPAERGARVAMIAAIIGVGTLALGSCSGLALAHYTVSGMYPLGDAPPAFAEQAPAEGEDWFRDAPPILDVKVEATDAEAGMQPPA